MSKEYIEPNLPESHKGLFYQEDLVTHERLAATSLSEFTEQMHAANNISVEFNQNHSIRFIDIRSDDEASSSEAIVMPLPFGNGFTPAMFIRAIALQSLLDEPKRILLFPNNSLGTTWYEPANEAGSMKERLARDIIRATSKTGIERASIVGYSQGATIGASILAQSRSELEIDAAMLGDPANVENRTSKKLQKDFQGDGFSALKALNKAINDSAIPDLTEAQSSGDGAFIRTRQLLAMGKFGLGAKSSVNRQLHEDMTKDDFISDLVHAETNELSIKNHLVVVRMRDSLVCTEQLDNSMIALDKSKLEVVDGYGHEGGDNIILHALLARLAISGY